MFIPAVRSDWRCVFVLLCLAQAMVHAQPAASPADAAASATSSQQVVVTGSDVGDERRESLTTKSVVTRKDIERYSDSNLSDTLRRVPGVTVVGAGANVEIRMRGMGAGYTQILVNGDAVPSGFSIESLSPALIERIEVLRAPTLEQSARGIAGTINIILRETSHKKVSELRLSGGGYAANPQSALDGVYGDAVGNLSYKLTGAASHEKNTWRSDIVQNGYDAVGARDLQSNTSRQESADDDTISASPSLTWRPDKSRTLTSESLLRTRSTLDRITDDRDTLLGAPPLYDSDALRLRLNTNFFRTKLGWHEELADEASIDAKLGASYNKRVQSSKFHDYDPSGAVLLDEDVHSLAVERTLNSNGKYRVPVVKDHGIALGWDGEGTAHDESRIQRQTAPAGYPAVDLDEQYRINVARLAVFAQDEWDIDSRLSAYWGARWEYLRTRVAGTLPEGVENHSSVLSPVFQGTWKLPDTQDDQLRLAVARTYKAPTVQQLNPRRYVATDNSPTTPDHQGDASLRPELAWGADVTYEHYVGKGGSLFSVNAFARRIDNVIVDTLSQDGAEWVSRPANIGRANVEGVALEANLNLTDVDPAWTAISLRANMAWNHSTVRDVPGPDNRLARQTPLTAGAGFDWPLPAWSLTVGADYSFAGGGPVQVSAIERQDPRPQRSLDAYALWKIGKATSLRLSGKNLLGQSVLSEDAVRYPDGSGSFDQFTTDHTSRVWKATLEHHF